jgi:ubiquinone/menaquinone biosynthesis C-methylase UbiE
MSEIVDRLIQRFRTKTSDPVPPKKLVKWVGPGDFEARGQEFMDYFVDLMRLKPDETVLDVGCGCGRMAVPLTKYMSAGAVYEGFDVMPELIKWCTKNITSRHPNFHFQVADIFNKVYNPEGKYMSHEYEFPYGDESFDFVFLTSVFTHMLPRDMNRYFAEIVRVLKPRGRSFITYFLLNDESRQLMAKGASELDFKYDYEGCKIISTKTPESAIAYEEANVLELYQNHSLIVNEPIRYGSWSGRQEGLSFQDIIVSGSPLDIKFEVQQSG